MFQNRKVTDFALKLFARALYKDPFVFKGLKQLHDAAHVVGDRLTHAFHILFGNHRAHAVVREKLGQNGAVNHPGDDVRLTPLRIALRAKLRL